MGAATAALLPDSWRSKNWKWEINGNRGKWQKAYPQQSGNTTENIEKTWKNMENHRNTWKNT